ncbi:EcoAI/FtnUII family type I restriction enzme subunit R [Megamonas funiformis]|uniref:EcoAI/FtnUII family type I restriction enzme subunit R n=1 Tax=Megamonas funiformis TaxID=437897 RepID=UPI00195947AF|nr:DEAD/DEAH box helicase family protein [Megamonas funiformis]MBM6651334.1 DEAD/DEAH box helicase family protein [Megamonas funiformis]
MIVELTEEDIKFKYITPAIENVGWDKDNVFYEYYITNGAVQVRGDKVTRGKRKKADYVLTYGVNKKPLAIIEAKKMNYSIGHGMPQAMEYAQMLDVKFAYSSNGKGFIEYDFFTGKTREIKLEEFPTPEQLWKRYIEGEKLDKDMLSVVQEAYYVDPLANKKPRYYQQVAIDRTVEAVAKNQKRILLVMATGTGKTYTAFQIVYRLTKAKKVNRVLYLADRNILIDQTIVQDFKPFEKVITKVKNRHLDSSYEIYMSLYQQLVGENGEEIFRAFKPEFFDLIIVDECHRGSAKEDSQWRTILEYFNSAVQIGLTATPKETKEISNLAYFGEPIYTYSLKQGIADGFLAPYKVIRVNIDRDSEGWRPYKGQFDKNGLQIEDKLYLGKDFDKNLIIDERTQEVAKRITKWLKENGRYSKTIVFCVDIEHAERMRQALINENSDIMKANPNYIMRITGDNKEGKAMLDYFIDPSEKYPTIVTTSKLMTTGVDAKTCKLIVLENNINSIIEFKQIIGRGTRLNPDYDKNYFTIMDFRGVTRLFADPNFDGDPIVIIEDDGKDENTSTNTTEETGEDIASEDGDIFTPPMVHEGKVKYHVDNVDVNIVNERVQYLDANGKLITESVVDFTKKNVRKEYASLDEFINAWSSTAKKQVILEELAKHNVSIDELYKATGKNDIDEFDLILHIVYDQKPLTRKERINNVKKRDYFAKYSPVCREVLDALMEQYKNEGIREIQNLQVLRNKNFAKWGTAPKIVKMFGGKEKYFQAVDELTSLIYNNETSANQGNNIYNL